MQPVQITVLGTANSTPIFLDNFQNPFQVSIACVLNANNATFTVQHCFDRTTAYLPTWDGSTNVTWFNQATIVNATGNISSNYAFPVVAVRLNVSSAQNATTSVTMFLSQANTVPS